MYFYLLLAAGFLLGGILSARSTGLIHEQWGHELVDNPDWKRGSKLPRQTYQWVLIRSPRFERREIDWPWTIGMALLATLGAFLIYVVSMVVFSAIFGYAHLDRHVELSALATTSEQTGHFFLGSGRIDDDPVFSYITDEEGGAHHLEHANANRSTIFETSGDDAYLDVIVQRLDGFIWGPITFDTRTTYQFHVPAGSIVSDYTVSAG